ncbi:MAG TPA: ABC transporter ATP-binding protein [Dongiaceae bacterium]|nr:ABC transporter ATP-binding protein [Dongiaceae bacterium]
MASVTDPILSIRDLSIEFKLADGWKTAVDRVDLDLRPGEIMGIVGESGSGKSQILLAAMGLTANNGRVNGSIKFLGQEIVGTSPARLDKIRGSAMSMIFQDPMTSLNPYLRVSEQLMEVLIAHQGLSKADARKRAIAMLERVHIPDAGRRIDLYPHEFSGGMRQRVMIAMALLCKPALLLADEPTTALDVTVQAQILELLAELAHDMGTTIAIVTHDLGVVSRLCDRVTVLYGGRVMEGAHIDTLFAAPAHPYTSGLIASTPRLDTGMDEELVTIPGQPRLMGTVIPGCPFEPRCTRREPRCRSEQPPLAPLPHGTLNLHAHLVACHRPLLDETNMPPVLSQRVSS